MGPGRTDGTRRCLWRSLQLYTKNARVGATERRGVRGGEGVRQDAHEIGLSTHR